LNISAGSWTPVMTAQKALWLQGAPFCISGRSRGPRRRLEVRTMFGPRSLQLLTWRTRKETELTTVLVLNGLFVILRSLNNPRTFGAHYDDQRPTLVLEPCGFIVSRLTAKDCSILAVLFPVAGSNRMSGCTHTWRSRRAPGNGARFSGVM
jgi:hypothetical protein